MPGSDLFLREMLSSLSFQYSLKHSLFLNIKFIWVLYLMWDPFLKCWTRFSNLSSTPPCSLRNYNKKHRPFSFSHCCMTLPLFCSSGAISTFCGRRLVFEATFNLFSLLIIATCHFFFFQQLVPFSCYVYPCFCFFLFTFSPYSSFSIGTVVFEATFNLFLFPSMTSLHLYSLLHFSPLLVTLPSSIFSFPYSFIFPHSWTFHWGTLTFRTTENFTGL